MSKDYDVDCLVIGGGPAGLTAAVYLARYRRKLVVFDIGKSRAAWIPESHNYPGFANGIAGTTLLSKLHEHAAHYKFDIVKAEITSLKPETSGFVASFDGGQVKARFVLLASGIVDKAPHVENLDQAIEEGAVRYCPVCDAFEASDLRIGVLGNDSDAVSKAKFLRTYSTNVTLLDIDGVVSEEDKKELTAHSIRLEGPVRSLERIGGGIRASTGTQNVDFDVVYPALGCEVRSGLARALGAEVNDVGCLKVDEHQRTTVKGLYAAGDVVSDLHQLAVATGHAAIAATHIHKELPDNLREG